MNITIRKSVEKDSEKIWNIMKELAVFEKYIDSFAITPEIVKESGFLHQTSIVLLLNTTSKLREFSFIIFYLIQHKTDQQFI
jgi:hypothetical protein